MNTPRLSSFASFATYIILIIALQSGYTALNLHAETISIPGSGLENMPSQAYASWLDSLNSEPEDSIPLSITEPRASAVLPANSASPVISWNSSASTVLVRLQTPSLAVQALCAESQWIPDHETWCRLRAAATEGVIDITVSPVGGESGRSILNGAKTHLIIDGNELLDPIAFLSLPVPFRTAKHHPQFAAWRKTLISEPGGPQTFLTDLPVCANCHAYSADGSAMLLDMDIDGDKGGFVLTSTRSEIPIERSDCRSWNAMKALPPAPFSFGLFARLSPDGNIAVSTVGETSLFVMIDQDDFSQLFFPVTGQIAIHDRVRNSFEYLQGTTDLKYVHTGPSFSPSGREIAFSRAPVRPEYVQAVLDKTVQKESSKTTIVALNQRYPYQFDLCTLPFPNAEASAPRPLAGASSNGKSNYFPRYSPDGRWIVFTQAPTGLVLQPDSKLCIIPATGGQARELACNTKRMNSWHSWSPDGKWLIFSAKGERDETEIFLARIFDDGSSSPAIRLHRLTTPRFACVVPEFLPGRAAELRSARLTFPQEKQIDATNNVR